MEKYNKYTSNVKYVIPITNAESREARTIINDPLNSLVRIKMLRSEKRKLIRTLGRNEGIRVFIKKFRN